MSSAPDQADKIVPGFNLSRSLYVTVDQVETKWGTFYKAAVLCGIDILTEAYARHPERAIGFAMRDYAEHLVEKSRG